MADALQVFKQALIAKKAADEAAARDAEAKIERARRVDGITRNFEAVVGEIVETVASAATELEASANVLTVDRRTLAGTRGHGRSRLRGSFHQRAVGGFRQRGADFVGQRDQPAGAGIARGWPAKRWTRRSRPTAGSANWRRRPARIGDVVELINTIAGQTNLLALECHHRGGARRRGRPRLCRGGVRSEGAGRSRPRRRPTRSASRFRAFRRPPKQSVGAIKEIGDTIGRMSEISSTIAAAVEEQGAATQEISRNIQQAAMGTTRSQLEHHRRAARRHRDRRGLGAGSLGGEVAFHREQPPQDRSREIPRTRCGPPNPVVTAAAAACRRNKIRWYSQPIATKTSPRHMNDRAR